MKNIIINGFLTVGIIGLIVGYPVLAYLSGIAVIWDHFTEVAKGAQTSTATFWMAIFVGLGFASISPFSWWQGILIGFTIEGGIIMMLSLVFLLISNRRLT